MKRSTILVASLVVLSTLGVAGGPPPSPAERRSRMPQPTAWCMIIDACLRCAPVH